VRTPMSIALEDGVIKFSSIAFKCMLPAVHGNF